MTSPITAVLFDIGGVIACDGPDMSRVATLLGLSHDPDALARVHEGVWGARDAYDLDLTDKDYWSRVAEIAGADRPTDSAIKALVTDDVERWARPATETVILIADLAAQGVRLGILSNAPRALGESFASEAWAQQCFNSMTFSYRIGVAKPHPDAYYSALDALGVDPEQTVFFDDRQSNVDAAAKLGIHAVLWEGADHARKRLRARQVLTRG